VRWLKTHAGSLGLDAARFGLAGQSSGGHLAMLTAMRPHDRRYAAIELAGSTADATVQCVAMTWPVINPISRYRHALRLRGSENPPAWTSDIPERHDVYWQSEAQMEEGNPMLVLERGEAVRTPPALWIQGRPDPVHDYRDPNSALALNEPERFAQRYTAAGGTIDVCGIEQGNRAEASLAPLTAFLTTQLGG
jgi:acetyl esterase/lipase